MPKSATITVYDENNQPRITFIRRYDGDTNVAGLRLQEFLNEAAIVGVTSNRYFRNANEFETMGELIARLIAFSVNRDGNSSGSFSVVHTNARLENHYEIRYVAPKTWLADARVSLFYTDPRGNRTKLPLYKDEEQPKILRRVQFVYGETASSNTKWRTLDVTEEDATYIKGLEVTDGNAFKQFLKSKIVGGKILPA